MLKMYLLGVTKDIRHGQKRHLPPPQKKNKNKYGT